MNWYKCTCGRIFNEESAETRTESETTEVWGERTHTVLTFLVCPSCLGNEYEQYSPCLTCVEEGDDRPREALAGIDECAICFNWSNGGERL